MMYALGVDLGFNHAPTGCALIDLGSPQPRLIETISFKARRGGDWQRRCDDVLVQFKDWLSIEILPHYPPILLCYELAHFDRNAQTALRLADLGGGVRGLAAAYGLECIGVSSAESKVALAGCSSATKGDMVAAARRIFGRELSEHEADAVGHALAGEALWRRGRLVREAGRG